MYSAITTTFSHGLTGARIIVRSHGESGASFDYPHHLKVGEQAHAWAARKWLKRMRAEPIIPAKVTGVGKKRPERLRALRGAMLAPGKYCWIVEHADGADNQDAGTYPVMLLPQEE